MAVLESLVVAVVDVSVLVVSVRQLVDVVALDEQVLETSKAGLDVVSVGGEE